MAAICWWRCVLRSYSPVKRIRGLGLFIAGGERALCTGALDSGEKKVRNVEFADAEVQDLLTRISGLNLQKVFHPVPQELTPPNYKLMTDGQLEKAVELAQLQAQKLLQMPPVLPERMPINDILSEDPILEGINSSKYVFTDITLNVPLRERFMVVREQSGQLRKASWEERDRILQIYFPKPGRKVKASPIFEEENLKLLFKEDRHEDILRLCLVQFEPDSALYKKVTELTYEDVDGQGKYNLLRSTRFFGGLCWYFLKKRRVEGLLVDMMQRDLVQDAVHLVCLFHLVHPQSESALQCKHIHARGIQLLQLYARLESQRAGFIDLAFQKYQQTSTVSCA
ncbi:small ribosomal subunit protein mS22 [Denticeps clupeoides]|uniref:Mitochondrial ribosomal protein S22 n=1 Tax=Denticeps clupeoides TaxID=299321 RepID=A0AAY4DDU5_9TELE|nr:28S ribosomal protein S22, mitochondrial [Denticeps clupeoides]